MWIELELELKLLGWRLWYFVLEVLFFLFCFSLDLSFFCCIDKLIKVSLVLGYN